MFVVVGTGTFGTSAPSAAAANGDGLRGSATVTTHADERRALEALHAVRYTSSSSSSKYTDDTRHPSTGPTSPRGVWAPPLSAEAAFPSRPPKTNTGRCLHVASLTRRTSLGRIQYFLVLRSNVVGGVHTASRAEAAELASDVASELAFRMAAYAPESANTAASNSANAPAKRSDVFDSSSGRVAATWRTRGPRAERGLRRAGELRRTCHRRQDRGEAAVEAVEVVGDDVEVVEVVTYFLGGIHVVVVAVASSASARRSRAHVALSASESVASVRLPSADGSAGGGVFQLAAAWVTAGVSARTGAQSSRVALASNDDDASAAAAAATRGGAKRTSSRKMACPGAEGAARAGNTVVARSRGTGPASRSRLRSACRGHVPAARRRARSSADDDDAEEDDDEEEDDMAPRERSAGAREGRRRAR